MAGVRPQARTGGGITAVHVWLIVFVVLWLGFAVATVLLAFKHEDLASKTKQAEDQRKAVMADSERGNFTALMQAAKQQKPARSLAGELMFRHRELAKRITGQEQDDLETIKTKMNAALGQIIDEAQVPDVAVLQPADEVALLEAAKQLYGWFVDQKRQAEQVSNQAADLAKQRDDAIAARDSQKQLFDRRVAEMEDQAKELEQQGRQFQQRLAELEKLYLEARGKSERAYDEDRRQLTEKTRTLEADQRRLEQLVERQGQIIARFRPKTEQFGLATQADGQVLTALPGDPIVYISIGSQVANPMTLGLTFEVYSADKPIPEGGQGKATLEVVNIHSDTSSCKIVHSTPGDPVVEGDYVVNPIYDRNQKYRFVVLGDFDLNEDGLDERDGGEKIRSLIVQWGGQVVEALDARTDFVVLGGRPGALGPLSEAATAQEVEQYRQKQARAQRYDRVLTEAKALRVTILTQHQFLNFASRSKGLTTLGGA